GRRAPGDRGHVLHEVRPGPGQRRAPDGDRRPAVLGAGDAGEQPALVGVGVTDGRLAEEPQHLARRRVPALDLVAHAADRGLPALDGAELAVEQVLEEVDALLDGQLALVNRQADAAAQAVERGWVQPADAADALGLGVAAAQGDVLRVRGV